jgi:hypothetical protein
MKYLLALVLLMFPMKSLAEDAIVLEKNKAAPYTGVLLPEEKLKELHKASKDLETEKEINESYKRSVDIYKENQKELLDQNKDLIKSNQVKKDVQLLSNFLMFGGGIAATGNLPTGAEGTPATRVWF